MGCISRALSWRGLPACAKVLRVRNAPVLDPLLVHLTDGRKQRKEVDQAPAHTSSDEHGCGFSAGSARCSVSCSQGVVHVPD